MSEGTRARGRLTPAPFAIPRDGGSIPPISTTWPLQVAVQGRAVVTVVSRWPASVVAVVLLVSISPRRRVRCAKKFTLHGLIVGLCAKKFALRARNTPNLTFFEVAGRILSRVEWGRGRAGRILSRLSARHRPRNSPWPDTTSARHRPRNSPWPDTTPAPPAPGGPATILCGASAPPHRRRRGFCTTRSLLAACRRRVGPSCSAIPPDW